MEIVYIYAFSRIPYSILRRTNKVYWLIETISSILFCILSYVLINNFQIPYSSIFISILYVFTGFVPRFIVDGKDKYLKIYEEEFKLKHKSFIVDSIGIVDITFISLMGISLGLTLYINKEVVDRILVMDSKTTEYYNVIFSILVFWIDKIMLSIMVLSGLIAALITLLWSSQLWSKTDKKSKVQYEMDIITSVKILLSLIVMSITALIFLLFPLANRINEINDKLNKL